MNNLGMTQATSAYTPVGGLNQTNSQFANQMGYSRGSDMGAFGDMSAAGQNAFYDWGRTGAQGSGAGWDEAVGYTQGMTPEQQAQTAQDQQGWQNKWEAGQGARDAQTQAQNIPQPGMGNGMAGGKGGMGGGMGGGKGGQAGPGGGMGGGKGAPVDYTAGQLQPTPSSMGSTTSNHNVSPQLNGGPGFGGSSGNPYFQSSEQIQSMQPPIMGKPTPETPISPVAVEAHPLADTREQYRPGYDPMQSMGV